MQNFMDTIKNRVGHIEATQIEKFFNKVNALCDTTKKQELFFEGQENTLIILPLELDYDIIFAGLILPLIRNNELNVDEFADYSSSINLVNSVLTIEKINLVSDDELLSFRSMLVAMAKDIRVIILKLADILNKSRHMKNMTSEEQYIHHKQVNDLYIPLASRLGLSYIKSELADLDLSYSSPNEYRKLMKFLAEDSKARDKQIKKVQAELKELLSELGINGEIQGRIKHVSSIYNKIHQKNTPLSQMYDLTAVRVLVNSVNECYSVLGAVHTKYMPLDGRFKDYVARPKANGYQSLHTTVLVDQKPLEIQIRTFEMHNHAEYGIAAHFLYKEHKNKIDSLDGKLLWIRKIIENPNINSSTDLINELKTDVYSGQIFVQTPLGKIIELPEDSTPIDFAYAIHSNVGNSCIGARVNGKMVPVNKHLNNADVVEIITSANAKGPSKDWLTFVKSASAKTKINAFFKKFDREDNIRKGKTMLEQSAKVKEVDLKKLLDDRWLPDLFAKYSLKNTEDMYAMIGGGALTTTQVLNRLITSYQQYEQVQSEYVFRPATVDNKSDKSSISELKSMLIKYAHCCNPVPGDEIVGFVSRGRGVTIHRADCKSIINLDADRIMKLSWNNESEETNFVASIKLLVKNVSGILANVANKIAEQKINITSISSHNTKDDKTIIDVDVAIKSKDELNNLMSKLKNI
ncbi:MAG: bifunctional (p)ppGpp synthetase/guanosine-3',5'-bis(diphosphate) 3'-pyrophosphohydrolase, partial [Clostridia bacterium]|nr:bifunctional (p)ppGpp synthetase/guanosine-3',5'-bis(diphosphate) 3'-pyrophosphohydrolase [Clostridia bacterium]